MSMFDVDALRLQQQAQLQAQARAAGGVTYTGPVYQATAGASAPSAIQAGDTPATGLSAAQRSARASIASVLDGFGLGSLSDRLWQQYLNGVPMEQLFADLRKTPEYKSRFPAMDSLSQKGRAISEQQYLDLERSYSQVMRAAGLPSGFYDSPDDFGKFIGGEVSPSEVADRVQLAATYAMQSPPEVRAEAARLYGWGIGEITALALDPNRALPLLQKQFIGAQTSATARQSGFGPLTANEAQRLTELGVSQDQARQGFSTLAGSAQLFTPLDAGEDAISRDVQLGAAFEGNADAQRRIENRARRRTAQFEGGGSFANGRTGFSGVGEAS